MKKLIIIIITLVLITGCASELKNETTAINKEIKYNETESIIVVEEEKEEIKTESLSTETLKVRDTSDSSTNADIKIINYVNDLNTEVDELTSSEITEATKVKLKESFITLTDFIFYEGTINGITFNELSTSVKEKVIEVYETIDKKIESVWPNYKETIKSTATKIYTNLKAKTIELKDELLNKYKESVGESAYNESVKVFEDDINRLKESTQPTIDYAKEKSQEAYASIKDKASSWYENFKESSE